MSDSKIPLDPRENLARLESILRHYESKVKHHQRNIDKFSDLRRQNAETIQTLKLEQEQLEEMAAQPQSDEATIAGEERLYEVQELLEKLKTSQTENTFFVNYERDLKKQFQGRIEAAKRRIAFVASQIESAKATLSHRPFQNLQTFSEEE